MVKTKDLDVDGFKCKIQEGMSFTQKTEFMQKISSVIDRTKLNEMKEATKIFELIKADLDPMMVSIDLIKYMLLKFVIEPKITQETLDNPDDPNSENYMILGAKMLEFAMESVNKSQLLKKTPTK